MLTGRGSGLGLGLEMGSLTRSSPAKSTNDPHQKPHPPRREEDVHPVAPGASPGERFHGQAKIGPGQNLGRL